MSAHPFDNAFRITPEHKTQFQRDGFVKLEGFLNGAVVDMLRDRTEREMRGNTRNTTTGTAFSRVQYDFESDKNDVYEMMARPLLPAGADGTGGTRSLSHLRGLL